MRLTTRQAHWLMHLYKHRPAVCFKVPVNVHNSLVEKGYCKEAKVPLVARPGLVLTMQGIAYAIGVK